MAGWAHPARQGQSDHQPMEQDASEALGIQTETLWSREVTRSQALRDLWWQGNSMKRNPEPAFQEHCHPAECHHSAAEPCAPPSAAQCTGMAEMGPPAPACAWCCHIPHPHPRCPQPSYVGLGSSFTTFGFQRMCGLSFWFALPFFLAGE